MSQPPPLVSVPLTGPSPPLLPPPSSRPQPQVNHHPEATPSASREDGKVYEGGGEEEEKEELIGQILELQNTLHDLSQRVNTVKEENSKLRAENQVTETRGTLRSTGGALIKSTSRTYSCCTNGRAEFQLLQSGQYSQP